MARTVMDVLYARSEDNCWVLNTLVEKIHKRVLLFNCLEYRKTYGGVYRNTIVFKLRCHVIIVVYVLSTDMNILSYTVTFSPRNETLKKQYKQTLSNLSIYIWITTLWYHQYTSNRYWSLLCVDLKTSYFLLTISWWRRKAISVVMFNKVINSIVQSLSWNVDSYQADQ